MSQPHSTDPSASTVFARATHVALLRIAECRRSHDPADRDGAGRALSELRDALAATDALRAHPTIRIRSSFGRARLANVPTLALLDDRETKTARDGLQCAFLFPEDSSGVYLALLYGVGATVVALKRNAARELFVDEAARVREQVGDLASHGFSLDQTIDLRSRSAFAADCRCATVAHKFFPAGALPDDATIEEDLAVLLDAYSSLVGARKDRVGPTSWIVPTMADARAGTTVSIGVVEYADWIRAGHDIYLHRAGSPSTLAVAQVLGEEHDPGDLPGRRFRVHVSRVVYWPSRPAESALCALWLAVGDPRNTVPLTSKQARAIAEILASL